jgi:hypothetical protein
VALGPPWTEDNRGRGAVQLEPTQLGVVGHQQSPEVAGEEEWKVAVSEGGGAHRVMARRRRNSGGASASSGGGASAIEGRRRVGGVGCSTGSMAAFL